MPQSLSQVLIHIVFSTKERKPDLHNEEARKSLHAYLAAVLKEFDSNGVIVNGPADHVHVLCSLSRTQTIADLVREMKRKSSKWMKGQGAEYKEFGWQADYGVFSVSASNLEQVRKYISGQEERHKKIDFKEELVVLLKKHGVEFDERYLWD